MATMHSRSRFGTGTRPRARGALVLFAAGSLAMIFEASAQERVAAVYKAREVDFFYRSSTNEYACDELRSRVANILLAVGARDDIDVRVSNCDLSVIPDRAVRGDRPNMWGRSNPADKFRPSRSQAGQSAHVRVRLMLPVEATPEVLAEIDKDRSRRELASRVSGKPAAALTDPVIFAAQRQQVKLARRPTRLEPEDCELLEQMTSSVFRELDVRVVRRNHNCDPDQLSRIPPQLTVEALLPATAAALTQNPGGVADPSEPAASENEPAEPADEPPPQ